jgi:hypothetical protein
VIPPKVLVKGTLLERTSGPCRENQATIVPSRSRRKPFLKLAPTAIPERNHKAVVDRTSTAGLAALGLDKFELPRRPRQSLSECDVTRPWGRRLGYQSSGANGTFGL